MLSSSCMQLYRRLVCQANLRFFHLVRPIMSDSHILKGIENAASAIKVAQALVVTAGAGMSVDSGLPDFRGPEGFWKAYPPIKKLGLSFPEVSTPRWFAEDPEFAWGFFGHRMQLYNKTKPHKGFDILRKWCLEKKNGYFVYTSNVDGHFQKAGFPEENVVECHGSLQYLQCVDGSGDIWPVPEDFVIDVDETTFRANQPLPVEPVGEEKSRQKLARPNVLMFNDWHFIEDRVTEQEQLFEKFMAKVRASEESFVVIEIGAGLTVPTIRWVGERLVRNDSHGMMIRINQQDTDIPSKCHLSLPLKGLEALIKIDDEMKRLSPVN